MKWAAFALLALWIGPLHAQEASLSSGGVLRWLDKVSGENADIELVNGATVEKGRLRIQLNECRYPTNNPSGDAWAHLEIFDINLERSVFSGWMLASSPALNALDHPRYDVWVLSCKIESGDGG